MHTRQTKQRGGMAECVQDRRDKGVPVAWPRAHKTDETKGVAWPSAYKTDDSFTEGNINL